MKPLRRSSSNSVRDLLAVFEGSPATTSSSSAERASSAQPATRRVTSSFIPVEPIRFENNNRLDMAANGEDGLVGGDGSQLGHEANREAMKSTRTRGLEAGWEDPDSEEGYTGDQSPIGGPFSPSSPSLIHHNPTYQNDSPLFGYPPYQELERQGRHSKFEEDEEARLLPADMTRSDTFARIEGKGSAEDSLQEEYDVEEHDVGEHDVGEHDVGEHDVGEHEIEEHEIEEREIEEREIEEHDVQELHDEEHDMEEHEVEECETEEHNTEAQNIEEDKTEENNAEAEAKQDSSTGTSAAVNNGVSTNGQNVKTPSPAKTAIRRLSNLDTSTRGITSSVSKASPSRIPSKSAEVHKSGGSIPTSTTASTNGRSRGPAQTISTQRTAPAQPQPKTNSSTRPARIPGSLTAPTASSSAKHETSTASTGPATARSRRPIDGKPHFLASTAASAAKNETANASESSKHQNLPLRPAESAKRDRTSITSTSNGAVRKPVNSRNRESLQTTNGTSTRLPGSRSSISTNATKPSNGDFLARMTRPTAASSGKTMDKSEAKPSDHPGGNGSVRGKPKESVTGSKRVGTASTPASRQTSATYKQTTNNTTGTTRGRVAPTKTTTFNGQKQRQETHNAPLNTTAESTASLQASPTGSRVEIEDPHQDVEEADEVPGRSENGTNEIQHKEEETANVYEDDADEAEAETTTTAAPSGLEALMMESLEKGVGVIR